jgi:S1-C subfamily serine protease
MKKLLIVSLFLFMVGCTNSIPTPSPTNATPTSQPSAFDKRTICTSITSSVFRITGVVDETDRSMLSQHGTAFIATYNNKPYIFTAHHTVKDCKRIFFTTANREEIQFKLKQPMTFAELDVVMWEVESCSAKILPLSIVTVPSRKRNISIVGYPQNGDKISTSGQIIVTESASDAFVEVGMSGGPCLNDVGEVAGIVVRKVISSSHENAKSIYINIECVLQRIP